MIVGGTAGPDSLSAFPDELLPYRPTALVDADPRASLTGMLGSLPKGATALPALAGGSAEAGPWHGRRPRVAAERRHGTGSVTLLGFDPATDWIADSKDANALWRRLLPARAGRRPRPDR